MGFFFAKIARDIYCSWVLQLIGWTPLIELKRITRDDGIHARIVGKVEAYQPLCSVKDRSALRFHSFSLFFVDWLTDSDGILQALAVVVFLVIFCFSFSL
jgi:hypothetical protein